MALNIKNDEAHALAKALAEATGETLTDAVTTALAQRLDRVRGVGALGVLQAEVKELQDFVRALPERARGSDEEILGYDEHGLPR